MAPGTGHPTAPPSCSAPSRGDTTRSALGWRPDRPPRRIPAKERVGERSELGQDLLHQGLDGSERGGRADEDLDVALPGDERRDPDAARDGEDGAEGLVAVAAHIGGRLAAAVVDGFVV